MSRKTEVLILDDEPIVGERLRDYLEKKNMTVEVFTSSAAAMKRLEEKNFHVVVTDIKMAKPDGIDVMVAVRKSGVGSEVVLITGYGSAETMRAAEFAGAFGHVCKPFKMEDIHKQIVKAAAKARKHVK